MFIVFNDFLCSQALDNSKNTVKSDGIKKHLEKIHQLLVTDIEDEREKFRKYIKNNPFKVEQEDWDHIIEFSETEVRDRLNDRTLLKNPALRYNHFFRKRSNYFFIIIYSNYFN